ncbi:MAG: ABC transporter permease [Oscillospiraceae bacterium]|nr:ABC transporter permease [Oscillospiraceae bacterium]
MKKKLPLAGALRSKAFTLVVLLVILVALFTVLASVNNTRFFTARTFIGILSDLAVPSFLAIGAGCLIVSGNIDLSQASVGAMAGVILAVGISWWQIPWWGAIVLAIAASAAAGLLNAVIVNELGIAPFVTTLAISSVIKGITMLLSTDPGNILVSSIAFTTPATDAIAAASFGDIPATAIVMVAAFIVYGLMLAKTKLGKSIYLIGCNRVAARLSGLGEKKISYFLFINCSALGGVSGVILSLRSKQGTMLALQSDQFTGVTAAILGGISFSGGSGGMGGAFMGLLVIKTFNKGMMIADSNTYLTFVLSGVLLIAALTMDYVSVRRQRKRAGA